MNKIINFHNVKDIRWFESAMHVLKNKFKIVDIHAIEDFYYSGKTFKNLCHLTVDDGDKTFYHIIYPVLKKMNIPATIFVSPKICSERSNFWFQEIRGFNPDNFRTIISDTYGIELNLLKSYPLLVILKNMNIDQIWDLINKYQSIYKITSDESFNMSVEQLIEIDKEGLITIGAHTINHPILANENYESSKKEIIDSINELENVLGHHIKYFAFPNGTPLLDFSNREIETLQKINVRLAFSTEAKNFTKKNNPLSIPRYGLSTGIKYFIKTKLLFGKYWNSIKNIKSENEIKLRLKLKGQIDFSNLLDKTAMRLENLQM